MPRSTLTWKKYIWKFNCSTSRPFQKGSVYKVLPIFEVCIFISKTELWKNTAPARRSCLLAHVEPFFHFQNSVGDHRSTTNQVKLMVQHYFWWFNNVKHYFWSLGWYGGDKNLGKTPNPTGFVSSFSGSGPRKWRAGYPIPLPFYLTTLDFDSQLKHDFFGFLWIPLDLDFWMDFELDLD